MTALLGRGFTLGDLLGRFKDNFYEIKINEYDGKEYVGKELRIPPHKVSEIEIPAEVREAKVSMLALCFNCLCIDIVKG